MRRNAEAHIIQNGYTLFESTIGVMPFYHTMGMRTLLLTTFLNGKLVLLPDYEPQAALELLDREKVTSLYLVPTLYYDLVSRPQLDNYDLRALTRLGYAGAAMTSTLTQACFERFHPRIFENHFGSSEVYADTSLTAEELDQFCLANPHLARFKRPKRYVFVKEVPKSPVGKILRRKLQAGEYELYDISIQE